MSAILRAENLSKHYGAGHGQVAAVRDVSLEVNAGEVVLVMGPSGSGKTTLLTMLGGLLTPDKGSVYYGEQKVTGMSRKDLTSLRAHYLGFVFQSFNLMPSLNALENVAVIPQLLSIHAKTARKDAQKVLEELGLGERLDHDIHQLSGGEQQRISIARALVTNPKLILADEPTANLDSKNGHAVMELLRDLARQKDCAVVVVSHDERIKPLADRILILEDGSLKTNQ